MISLLIARPKPVPLGLAVSVSPTWLNFSNNHRLVGGGDADALVDDVDLTSRVFFAGADLDRALRGEFDCIRDQVDHHLLNAVRIAVHQRQIIREYRPRNQARSLRTGLRWRRSPGG